MGLKDDRGIFLALLASTGGLRFGLRLPHISHMALVRRTVSWGVAGVATLTVGALHDTGRSGPGLQRPRRDQSILREALS